MTTRQKAAKNRRWDVATVGQIYVDHVFSGLPDWPKPGEEVFTRNYLAELGGGAAITACGLALLGRRTAVFGVVGKGESAWIDQRFQFFGVSTEGLESVDGASGVTVSVSVTQERSFYTYCGTNDRLMEYMNSDEVAAALQQASHVHFAAPLDRSLAQNLLPLLKQAGCTLSIDVGWQPEWYKQPANLQTCMDADYFLPNEKEARFLAGRSHTENNPEDAPGEILRQLERIGLVNAVVKLGAKGAMALEDGHVVTRNSLPVQVIDTTGAGDAFDAGLIDALLDDCNMEEILRRASVCGSLSTRTPGALRALATRQELKAYE